MQLGPKRPSCLFSIRSIWLLFSFSSVSVCCWIFADTEPSILCKGFFRIHKDPLSFITVYLQLHFMYENFKTMYFYFSLPDLYTIVITTFSSTYNLKDILHCYYLCFKQEIGIIQKVFFTHKVSISSDFHFLYKISIHVFYILVYIKLNSKWMRDPNAKPNIMKLLEET